MRQRRHAAPFPRAHRLCRLTLIVPEDYIEGLRQLAVELRARHQSGFASVAPQWRAISPSAELLVDPQSRARCAVRDMRAPGLDRFQWSVTVLGQSRPIAVGRTGQRAEARSLAEQAFRAYVVDWREPSDNESSAVADGPQ